MRLPSFAKVKSSLGSSVLLVQRVGTLLRAQSAPWSLNLNTPVMIMEAKWPTKRQVAQTLAQTLQKATLDPKQRQHILIAMNKTRTPLTQKTTDHCDPFLKQSSSQSSARRF